MYIDEPSSADGATLRASLLAWALDPTLPGTAVLQLDAEYQYDVWGNRTQKIVDAGGAGDPVATRFAYDGWNPGKPSPIGTENFDIWATFDDESSLTSREIQGAGFDEHLA